MTTYTNPSGLICDPFERTDGVYTLQGAICLTEEQWGVITPEELTAMQDERWVNWLAIITAPAPENPQVE